MKQHFEIRAAEGGDDAKLFAQDLYKAYVKMFSRFGWKHRLVSEGDGTYLLEVSGENLSGLLNEVGGHRVQRVPPTERKGRVHTSTVVVTCVDAAKVQAQSFNESDFKVEWYSGTGAGGQYRNKHQNSCRITHLPTGVVSTSQCRSRENSFAEAQASILEKLNQRNAHSHAEKAKAVKSAQGGSGERGDKIRTYMFQHGIVTHHSTGVSLSVDKVMAGKFDLFW